MSKFVTYTTFQALGASVLASVTLKDAFTRIERYGHVATDAGRFRFESIPDGYRLALEVTAGTTPPSDEALDALLSLQVRTARSLSDRRDLNPRDVELVRPEPVPSAPFREFFRAPVRFASHANVIEFTRADLEARLPGGNAELARRADEVLTDLEYPGDRRVASRVRATVAERLGDGEPQEQAVARALGMSLRTLQRRLADEGMSFNQILNDIRKELACAHMERGSTVTEAAFALGFADTSSFSRAFRRWTGAAPSAYVPRRGR